MQDRFQYDNPDQAIGQHFLITLVLHLQCMGSWRNLLMQQQLLHGIDCFAVLFAHAEGMALRSCAYVAKKEARSNLVLWPSLKLHGSRLALNAMMQY